ncbi:multidrug efflux pump subunit AcrB [Parabacteroides sp. PFB2-10]|uniref:efflux RND transporter permease subunit n=1 Tax=Parabacteroides sp. PFB2-10 TaxID=1742405 RepID=UPI0024737AA2|nr:efflux RND transporter permease subunit [Parabacteroides sp. PFB2-10]MDH6313406.1 multidrug efflux pump subunit AcrB [Parabacteroides sp. PFB2-10]MDL2245438.1 efflux RND transporter permease subunit [Parabacteroides sp. OttesenSCG-928-J18]
MLKFLLQRPIAVLMAFTACFILGLVTYFTLPVSLLPDIAIPEITVQVSAPNTSARELENSTIKKIRQQLMQVSRLRDIQSETRDGAGIIRLNFDFGTNTDLAFIEVNEKIDISMSGLPRDIERPRVVKASATDIPVFCLNLTLKSKEKGERRKEKGNDSSLFTHHSSFEEDEAAFLELCEFAESVIKRRIEQLPEVAMVDITGMQKRQLQIIPDLDKMKIAGLSLSDLESALASNNIEPGSMTVRDGYYEYNIKFSTLLRTPEDVENIYIRKGDRIFQMKELAKVAIAPEKETGLSMANGKRAVTLAIIKQADENMDNMKEALEGLTAHFERIYPDIDISITRNQTELLDYTISNLKENLGLGFLFICIVAILFLGDVKSPTVIGLSMVVSIVISFFFFYIFDMSLNIISLSGLILALGMMIDSSIIVTENIMQYRAKGYSLDEACEKGTSEVVTPMLSSTFTTIAVFVPLVFMSGIAGAIFFDQAFAVTVGLLVSYFTGIMLLPVLYKLVYSIPPMKKSWINRSINNPIKAHTMDKWYDGGINFVFRYRKATLLFVALTIPLCVLLFMVIPTSRMPEIDQNELIAHLEWNENIHIDENRTRTSRLFDEIDGLGAQHTAYIGQQQFILNRDQELSVSEAELYFKTEKTSEIAPLQQHIERWIKTHYPLAVISFSPPETVFEKLFVTGEADVVAEFYSRNRTEVPDPVTLRNIETTMTQLTGHAPVGIAFENQLNVSVDRQKLLLYNVDYNEVYRVLRTAFKENEVATLRSYQQYLPIALTGNERTIQDIMQTTLIRTLPDKKGVIDYVPLQSLVRVTPGEDLKNITAGKNGEFIPFSFYQVKKPAQLIEQIREAADRQMLNGTVAGAPNEAKWDIDYSGSFFSNKKMLNELVIILMISVILMYFILAAQFESFLQPFIVLLELPIDVAASLLVLWMMGHTLNLMSAIGIVVTCGIIINDSILKLDVINELRKEGMPLMEAIHEGGRRRLRPIIMTSLTTIFAMVPLLFSFDMGSELQKPLSIAMISAMFIGTLVSLFIIPLVYWFIYRKEEVHN